MEKAYEFLLNAEPSDYAYSNQDLVGIDEGVAQAERGEHVADDEVVAFFAGWEKKFKAAQV